MPENNDYTVPSKFKAAVSRWGDRVAMRKKEYGLWNDITWNQYDRNVSRVACALMSLGLQKGDCASIIGDNCPEWVYADLGIQCCGAATAGVYSTNAWQQVEYVVTNSDSKIFFVENEEQLDKWFHFRDRAPKLEKIIVWDTKGLREFKDPMVMTFDQLLEIGEKHEQKNPGMLDASIQNIDPEDLSVLIYTSGTTGQPKGAMLTHKNCVWMGRAITSNNPMFDNDEIMSFLPLCHIFEQLFTILAHFDVGHVVNFIESMDTITDNMIEISPTVGHAVPRIWEKYYSAILIRMADATWFKRFVFNYSIKVGRKRASLVMAFKPVPITLQLQFKLAHFAVFRKLKKRLGFDRIRVAYSGAAPIAPEILRFFHSIGVNLVEGYGQTEGTGVTTTAKIGEVKFGTVGVPLEGVEIKIADDGEILVRSPGVFKGYFKNPAATAETIVDGWLYSGDVGTIDDDGYLSITDRKKDIIVTAGGKNITPQYIENKLKSSLYINDAVVIGDKRKFLTCLIIIDEDNVVKFAQDNKIQFSTYKDLTAHEQIKTLIDQEIKIVNEALSQVEKIKKFTILPKKLYEEDGEMTPTMKVKRNFINKAFNNLIEAMY
jgi:long-chain acyl-CoA synthetase